MKKILSIFTLFVAILSFSSCSEKSERMSNVTFNAHISDLEIDVKSSNISGEYKLLVGIFQNGEQLSIVNFPVNADGTANAVLSLVSDQTYDLVFWAQGKNAKYITDDLSYIKLPTDIEDLTLSASKQYDAFYALEKGINFSGSITKDVHLERVVGLLNILSPEAVTVNSFEGTKLSYTSFSSFKPFEGVYGDECVMEQFIKFPSTGQEEFLLTEKIGNENCTVLANGYFFSADKIDRNVEVTTYKLDGTELKKTVLTSVPFEGNKRTNIVGNFL